jgi:hypothetical protein
MLPDFAAQLEVARTFASTEAAAKHAEAPFGREGGRSHVGRA